MFNQQVTKLFLVQKTVKILKTLESQIRFLVYYCSLKFRFRWQIEGWEYYKIPEDTLKVQSSGAMNI